MEINVNELMKEADKMVRFYESFKGIYDVLETMKQKAVVLSELDRSIKTKEKMLKEAEEKYDHAKKEYESNVEKRNIQLKDIEAKGHEVRKQAEEYREHERAKGAEYIHNANEYVKSLETKIETYKKSVQDWERKEAEAIGQYKEAAKQVEQLRSLLK